MSGFARPLLAAAMLAALSMALPAGPAAGGDERDGWMAERTGHDEPLRFRAENGGAFRPREVIVATPGGALAARLPAAADIRNENRVDLSGLPGVGPLFRDTLDVASAREGALVGPVYRVGDTLVVDAQAAPPGLSDRRVSITTNLPRWGAISYDLGRLAWAPAAMPAGGGVQVGTAHVLGGALVLASQGGEPAWPSLEALFRDAF